MNYVKNENSVEIGDSEEIFAMWVNSSEKTAIELSRSNFEVLEKEVEELRKFKSDIEFSEKTSKLSQYASVLSEEDYKYIQENLSKFSIEGVEKEIAYKLLKNNNFTSNHQVEPKAKVSAQGTTGESPYGSISTYFYK